MVSPAGFVTRPLSASSSPAIIFSSVVFPAPFGPARPTRSPSSICQLTASRRTRPPNDFESEESWITGVGPLGFEPKETGKRAILAHACGRVFFTALSFAAVPVALAYARAAHVRKSSMMPRSALSVAFDVCAASGARGQDYGGEDEEAVQSRRADARGTDIRAP